VQRTSALMSLIVEIGAAAVLEKISQVSLMDDAEIVAQLRELGLRKDFIVLLAYTPTRLDLVCGYAGRPRRMCFDLEGACTSQAYEIGEHRDVWAVSAPQVALGREFLPFNAGVDEAMRSVVRQREYTDYVYRDVGGAQGVLRLHRNDQRGRVAKTGLQVASKKRGAGDPFDELWRFDAAELFARLARGEPLVLASAHDAGMSAQGLAYRAADAGDHVFSRVAGDLRALREQGELLLAYALARRVEVGRREEAMALARAPRRFAADAAPPAAPARKPRPRGPAARPISPNEEIFALVQRQRGATADEAREAVAACLGFASYDALYNARYVRRQAAIALHRHPGLGQGGFGDERALLIDDEATLALEWLVDWASACLDPAEEACARGSDALRHDAALVMPSGEVSNGQLILAMLICGYRHVEDGANARFWITPRSAKQLSKPSYHAQRLARHAASYGLTLDPAQAGQRRLATVRRRLIRLRESRRFFLARLLAMEVCEAEREEALALASSDAVGVVVDEELDPWER
jgi:hypothetical protein